MNMRRNEKRDGGSPDRAHDERLRHGYASESARLGPRFSWRRQ